MKIQKDDERDEIVTHFFPLEVRHSLFLSLQCLNVHVSVLKEKSLPYLDSDILKVLLEILSFNIVYDNDRLHFIQTPVLRGEGEEEFSHPILHHPSPPPCQITSYKKQISTYLIQYKEDFEEDYNNNEVTNDDDLDTPICISILSTLSEICIHLHSQALPLVEKLLPFFIETFNKIHFNETRRIKRILNSSKEDDAFHSTYGK